MNRSQKFTTDHCIDVQKMQRKTKANRRPKTIPKAKGCYAKNISLDGIPRNAQVTPLCLCLDT